MSQGDISETWVIHSGADFGLAIAGVRLSRGLTQSELAVRAGLSREYIAKIEAGRTVSLLEHELRTLHRMGARVWVTLPLDDAAP